MPAYVVEAVNESWDWDGKFGKNRSYKLHLKGPDGASQAGVELAQKLDTPAPQVGQTLQGTLDTSGRYVKFRKDQQPGGFGGGGPRPRDPKESAQIVRQWAVREALVYARLRHDQGKLPEDFTFEDLFMVADVLERHVKKAQS
jgi:hypothetical protein